ncbi:MAG TPA: PadR family transcriptional regulator, partial [Actinomycetota bacterium]|nr:PadR family transcriptional regulator [Actinomycetota bacterium]
MDVRPGGPRLGKVDLVALGLLAEGPAHGYELLERARARRADRWVPVGRASVYQALRRLERAGLVAGRDAPGLEGPERRVYRLTAAGRERLLRGLEALAAEVGPYEAPGTTALGFLSLLEPARARAALAARKRATLVATTQTRNPKMTAMPYGPLGP